MERNTSDRRPESYSLRSRTTITILEEPLPTKDNWRVRKMALKNTPVYTSLKEIIGKANKNSLSLCQFKPSRILRLEIEESEREWDESVLNQVEARNRQGVIFEDMKREIKLVDKLPYKFSYRFVDDVGKESSLMISDWEIGQLYWNCLKSAHGDETVACQKVKEKYENFIEGNDITLFFGNDFAVSREGT